MGRLGQVSKVPPWYLPQLDVDSVPGGAERHPPGGRCWRPGGSALTLWPHRPRLTALVIDGLQGGGCFCRRITAGGALGPRLPAAAWHGGPSGEPAGAWRSCWEGEIDPVHQPPIRQRDLSPAPRSRQNSQISLQAFSIRHTLPCFDFLLPKSFF